MRRRGATRGEGGETLIEILMTVVIVGLVFTGILGAMVTNTVASNAHRGQADAMSVLLSAAERIRSSDTPYVSCVAGNPGGAITNPSNPYLAAARSVPPPPTGPQVWNMATAITIPSVTYEFRDNNGTTFTPNCYNASGLTMQLITLQVTSPGSNAVESISIVKESSS